MTVQTVLDYLWELAPLSCKQSWDNVGLLLGRSGAEVRRVLTALDLTAAVAEEAVRLDCQLIVTHHPAIFKGDKHITDTDRLTLPELICLENRIAVISMHTNLDCAPGGVNDVLAGLLGLHNIYVLPDDPEPALIRVGTVETCALSEFAAYVKKTLGCAGVRYVDAGKPVCKVAVGGGSCIEFVDPILETGCDTFVTGDVKYHQFLNARARGLNIIDAGHFGTENPVVGVIRAKLAQRFPELEILRSAHGDCVRFL